MSTDKESNSPAENTALPLAMNRQQSEVFALLQGLATQRDKFHEWYHGAIQVINSKSPDKVAQAAHSIRELCDKLPDRIANIPKFNSPVPPVKSLRRDFLEVKAASYANGWEEKVINKSLGKLLLHMEDIFKLFNEPPRTARLKLALTSSDLQVELMSKQQREARDEMFEKMGNFFQDVTHHKREATESEFREELERFESLLLNYLTPCTAVQQKELMELIKGPPTPEALKRANELISHKGANFAFFFEKLDNPTWLGPLDRQGYFTDLPGPEPTRDGRVVYRYHVPLLALTRLASIAPKEVTNVLVKLKLSDNPRIGDQVLQCMASIRDPACIPQLRPLVGQLMERSSRTTWVWIQEVLETWIALEAFSDVLAITEIFLSAAVEASFDRSLDPDAWLANQIDEKVLENLTPNYPFEIAHITFNVLGRWAAQKRREHGTGDLADDVPFTYWLEDFTGPLTSRRREEIEGTLALRLFAAAERIYRQGDTSKIDQLDQLLRSNPWRLFQRLRWQLYANLPSLSRERARTETLSRIAVLDQLNFIHDYEFAQLLKTHSEQYGEGFLSSEEVVRFFNIVMNGPVDKEGKPVEGYQKEVFYRKQLWPIARLLKGEQLAAYRVLVPDEKKIGLESFKPFRSGGGSYEIVQIAPAEADKLDTMDDEQLWTFLNTWEPTRNIPTGDKWVQEDCGALATKFAELVEREPERFNPGTRWWEKLKRPVMLYKAFERATDHFIKKQNDQTNSIPAPTENDWLNWFGIAKWIIANRKSAKTNPDSIDPKEPDWTWAWNSIARFLRMALKSDYVIPEPCVSEVRDMLENILAEEDSRWVENQGSSMSDWLTMAINSNLGNAIEALLNLAFRQKKAGKEIEPWIFPLIRSRLERPEESPEIFALLGANLRFLIYLFGLELKGSQDLLYPPDRPAHRRAAIVSHFRYDQPIPTTIETFPALLNNALEVLKSENRETENENAKQEWRDFGSRLGIHIVVYYWNNAFSSEAEGDATLDQYFESATGKTRASLISQIGSIFERASKGDPDEKLLSRVMRIWERRYAQIEKNLEKTPSASDRYDGELAEFTDWLDCECFPFEWRFKYAMQAIGKLQKAPHSHNLLKTISEFSGQADRLDPALQLLRAILAKPSDELRWSIQFKELGPTISSGLSSANASIQRLAEECRDSLLKLGFFDFLDVAREAETKHIAVVN